MFSSKDLEPAILPKELSWIGRPGVPASVPASVALPSAAEAARRVRAQLAWLAEQRAAFGALAARQGKVGIFGTAISATWLAGMLGEQVAFFVDEDEGRIGATHLGRPIHAPDEVEAGADILVPLIPSIAEAVAARLERPGVRYHLPAPLEVGGG